MTGLSVKNNGESGSVLVEASIVLPVIIFMIVGTLNIGLLFADYLFMSQIAREVALRGSRIPYMNLTDHIPKNCTSIPSNSQVETCTEFAENPVGLGGELPESIRLCAHTQMCFYGQRLASTKRLWTFNSSVAITTQFVRDPDVPSLCTVRVTVNGLYDGLLTLYRNTPITITSQAGYVSEPYTCT